MATQATKTPVKRKYLNPQELRPFKNLLFAARVIVEGAYSGRHQSPFKGASQEFTEYREYNPGDELRLIDWKAYGRTDRYIVKLFEKETDMNCYLLVDASASMAFGGKGYEQHFGKGDLSKFDYAATLAAALAYLTIRQGDRVGLTLFDTKVRSHHVAGATFTHLYTLLNSLESCKPGQPTAISQTLREAFCLFRRRGLLIVLSDFLDDPEEIFQSLGLYTHRGFDVLLLQIFHRYEYELPSLPSVKFIDAETGQKLVSKPDEIRDNYHREIGAFIEQIGGRARARRIDYEFVNTQTPYQHVLQRFLQKRS